MRKVPISPGDPRTQLFRDHGPDLDQEVLTLAWEAYSHRLSLKQAGSHIRRGLYAFVRCPHCRRRISRAGWRGLVEKRFHGDVDRARQWLGKLGA